MVRAQLHLLVKTEKSDVDESLLRGNITAAAGSESQLHHVEQELNQRKSKSTAEGCTLGAISIHQTVATLNCRDYKKATFKKTNYPSQVSPTYPFSKGVSTVTT